MTLTLEKQQVLSQIQQLLKKLTPLEKLFLSEQLTADVRSQLFHEQIAQEEQKTRVRLSNFAGVGAELWRTIDVDQYIRQERDAWQIESDPYVLKRTLGWTRRRSFTF